MTRLIPDSAQPQPRRRPTLEQSVSIFARALLRDHGDLFSSDAKNAKTRVISLLARQLPPYPARCGRKPVGYISAALALYNGQKRDVSEGRRTNVGWQEIANAVIPEFSRYRTDLRRRFEIAKLREAVHSRRRRARIKAAKAAGRRSRE